MRIRHPGLIKALALVFAPVIRTWISTLGYRYRPVGPNVDPRRPGLWGRNIYAFWHENMLLPAYHYARPDITALVSQHADGELIAAVCRHLGFRVVRGSSTRGRVRAVRELLRVGRGAHLAITPDGPQGPRRRVQPGLIYVASQTGLPIVPTGFGYQRPWRLGSWDRFAVPRPWTRTTCVTAPPIHVPANLDRGNREWYRRHVEEALLEVSAVAEDWAATGRRPRVKRPRAGAGEEAARKAS